MKKLYFFAFCIVLGASLALAGPRFQTKKGNIRKAPAKTEAKAEVWRPATVSEFINMEGEWLEISTTEYTYDVFGNATVMEIEDEDGVSRIDVEYNEYNRPVLRMEYVFEDGAWEKVSKRTYVYDPIVHTFYTDRTGYDWSGDSWVKNYYCETNVITRNADGNITEIVKSLPFGDDMYAAYKSEWKYDAATKRANEFNYYVNYSLEGAVDWELDKETSYRNIVWDATDGQMVESSFQEMVTGANRVKSADVYYAGELDGHVIVEYTGKDGEYLFKDTYADPSVVGRTVQVEIIDDFGSVRRTECEYFDEDGEPTSEPTYELVEATTIDKYGNAVEEAAYETFDGYTEKVGGVKYDYVYDDNGNPLELVVSVYDYESDEYFLDQKFVYDGYSDVAAGIDGVLSSGVDSFTVYNLQGMLLKQNVPSSELSTLPEGLYIVNGKKLYLRR